LKLRCRVKVSKSRRRTLMLTMPALYWRARSRAVVRSASCASRSCISWWSRMSTSKVSSELICFSGASETTGPLVDARGAILEGARLAR
jgi:hypothetical protein